MTIPLLANDPHDTALRKHVKPPDWVNPTPAARYQLVVVGGGSAGLVCAVGAAGLGAKVALVERDLLGGDCLNVGCVPSKTLLRAAKAAAEVRRARQFGINVPEPEINFATVMERVRQVRAALAPTDSAERVRSLGVDVFLGEGKFLNEDTIEVSGAKLRFGRCVIATGSRPAIPEIPGLKESRYFTNETVFTLTELPRHLLVIGAGPVGCELGQAFARLGSKVTLVANSTHVLPTDERSAGGTIHVRLTDEGVSILLDRRIDYIGPEIPESRSPRFPINARWMQGDTGGFIGTEAILVATGRLPNIESLNLKAAGVQYDQERGIAVDDYLRTTNRRIFAAGDVCAIGLKFTHAADAMARLAIRNALFPTKSRMSALTIPWCTYTDPEVGRLGLSEKEANERSISINVFQHDFQRIDRAATDGAEGFIKVMAKKGTDQIVGATVVAPNAGELISTLSVAMTNSIGLKALANTVFPYPTYTEAIKKIADQYNRTRLTPRAKWLIGKWLKWFR
jgi:pyruvate/2-oxoglutarate dehydrogenase complex dihydrolipoamide dehydrogenase (E3) component